jgi:hypothetical protein
LSPYEAVEIGVGIGVGVGVRVGVRARGLKIEESESEVLCTDSTALVRLMSIVTLVKPFTTQFEPVWFEKINLFDMSNTGP